MRNKKRFSPRYILLICVALLCILAAGASVGVYGNTLINPWIIPAAASAVAIYSGIYAWRRWKRLTGLDSVWPNLLAHSVFVACMLTAVFYLTNYYGACSDTVASKQAEVVRLYSETHYRSKRISRRVYGRGEPYYVYFAVVRFTDTGRQKDMSVTRRQYSSLHTGDTLNICVERGLLGVPVIIRRGRQTEVPQSSHRFD